MPRANPSTSQALTQVLIPLILALAIVVSCYFASGVSLGLFFGPMLLITFLASPLAMGEETCRGRLIICAVLAAGVWLVWLVTADLSFVDAARCGLVAMNTILVTQPKFWDRYTLAYQQLTTLNQDILYTLPRTVVWMVGWHFAIGGAGFSLSRCARGRG